MRRTQAAKTRGLAKEAHGESHEAGFDLRENQPPSPVGPALVARATTLCSLSAQWGTAAGVWRFGFVRQTTQIGDTVLPINGFGGST